MRIREGWHSGAPYSPAVVIGPLVFLSGAVPIDPASGDTVGRDITAQTERVLDNLELLLQEAGGDLSDVVKTTVFLVDAKLAADMNAVYARRFTGVLPARSTVQVGPLARPEYLLEIEAIAVLRS